MQCVIQESTGIQESYKKKAKLTTEILNSLENVKCNEVAGSMYAFPRITLPQPAINAAKVTPTLILLLAFLPPRSRDSL